jgi:flagellin
MAQYINTNIAALNSQLNLSKSQMSLQTSLQRLSSGLRINSAADDAAGYAIASRMTSQINGLDQAARNANDGISLAQTAQGALSAISDNLQTMRSLAVQASNATATASDRASINTEIQQLSAEIQRVATTTTFNGTNLLDGSFAAQAFQVGANQGQNISINQIASMQTSQLGSAGTSYSANVTGGSVLTSLGSGDLTLNGYSVGASQLGNAPGQSAASAFSIANAVNAISGNTGVTATANSTTYTGVAATVFSTAAAALAANSFSVNGINVGAIAIGGTAQGQGANVAAAINAVSGQSGVTATADTLTGKVTLTAIDGRNINVQANVGTYSGVAVAVSETTLQNATGLAGTAAGSGTYYTDTAVASSASLTTAAGSLTVNGLAVTATTSSAVSLTNAQDFVAYFNAQAAVTANSASLGGLTASNDANGVVSITSNGTLKNFKITGSAQDTFDVATYAAQHGTVSLTSTNSNGIVLGGGNAANAGFATGTTGAAIVASVNSVAALSTTTAANAQNAITTIDGALAIVNSAAATLGAYQNRFQSTVSNTQNTVLNLSASRSRIQDTDFAAETGNLTRAQILQQAGTAMLAQANSSPNGVLTLLR